jgi:hypothetical protein
MKTSNEEILKLIWDLDAAVRSNHPDTVLKILSSDVSEEDFHYIVCGDTEPYTDEYTAQTSYSPLKTALELNRVEIATILITHHAPMLNLAHKYVPSIDALTVIAETCYHNERSIDAPLLHKMFEHSQDKTALLRVFCDHFHYFLSKREFYYINSNVDDNHYLLLDRTMKDILTVYGEFSNCTHSFVNDLILMDEAIFGPSQFHDVRVFHVQWLEKFQRLSRLIADATKHSICDKQIISQSI